jgi:hypothetical protein
MNPSAILRAGLVAATLLTALHADTDPKDVIPPPPGTDAFLLYHNSISADKSYTAGSEVPGFNLNTEVSIARYIHFGSLAGHTYMANLIMPFGNVQLDGPAVDGAQLQSSGLGDIMGNFTFWLANDPKQAKYWGAGAFLVAPTGEYDKNSGLNLGDHRWSLQPQSVVGRGFGKCFGELGAQCNFYTERKAGATQLDDKKAPLENLWAHLSYDVTPAVTFTGSIIWNQGGETQVAGVKMGDKTDATSAEATAMFMLTPQFQLLVQFRQDTWTRNGPATNQMNTRIAYFF